MGKKTGLAGPAVGASKMLQGRPCLWSTFEVESSLAFGALKWGPIVSQPRHAGHTEFFGGVVVVEVDVSVVFALAFKVPYFIHPPFYNNNNKNLFSPLIHSFTSSPPHPSITPFPPHPPSHQ